MILVVPRKKSEFNPGEHPHSQENLQPREPTYGESKKRRPVMVTDEGWEGFKVIAKRLGVSASELVERIGRGIVKLKD